MDAYINQIAVATGDHECHGEFLDFISGWLDDAPLLRRLKDISAQSAIDRRYSMVPHLFHAVGGEPAFYGTGANAGTGLRMQTYQRYALPLALKATRGMNTAGITDLVVASCTGYYSPGLDLCLARELGLPGHVRRTLLGHMGCYAAMPALRMATDTVRANPQARVLVVCVELCSLHLQKNAPLDHWIASLLFSDGCAAALVSAEKVGPRLDGFHSQLIPDSAGDMRWIIGDHGFEMSLDARVADKISRSLSRSAGDICCGLDPHAVDDWAIHPGGRRILDRIEAQLGLPPEALGSSRKILAACGNMSSATVLFVLQDILANAGTGRHGVAMAFGPGLCVESLRFQT